MIQLFKPIYAEETSQRVIETLKSGWTGLGRKTEEFEEEFAKYVGVPYAIAMNSGTSALEASVHCFFNRGKFVITSPLTFISAIHCISKYNLIPIFADIDIQTGHIDPKSVEKICAKFTDGVQSMIVTHYGGCPVNLNELRNIANPRGFTIIEDAAHACGATYKGAKVGSFSPFTCFSFHAVKNLPIADGGMVTTSDERIAKHLREWRWCGIDKSTSDRTKGSYSWDYNVSMVGEKAHMNDLMATIGLVQLKHLDSDNDYRRKLVDHYYSQLQDIDGISLLSRPSDRISSCHLMVILVDNRDNLMSSLKEKGIQTGVHYRPAYHYKIYKDFYRQDETPNTELFFKKCLSLPLHLGLKEADIDYVCETIKKNI